MEPCKPGDRCAKASDALFSKVLNVGQAVLLRSRHPCRLRRCWCWSTLKAGTKAGSQAGLPAPRPWLWVFLSPFPLLGLAAAPSGIYETLQPSKTGITWRHDNARSSRRYLPESMGPGVAIFDYDNDGWMD